MTALADFATNLDPPDLFAKMFSFDMCGDMVCFIVSLDVALGFENHYFTSLDLNSNS